MVFIRENSKLFYAFMVVLYFLTVQQSLNTRHTHTYANGTVITHSHPIDHENGKPIQDHDHTSAEICFYHQVNFDYYTYPGTPQIILQDFPFPQDHPLLDEIAHFQYAPQKPVSRGPPVSRIISV
jgi:hypothetical protein